MSCLIASPITSPPSAGSIAPEVLCDTLFHDTAYLAAGCIVFDADGQVAKSLSIHKGKALFCDGGTLVLDESLFRVQGEPVRKVTD